MKIGYYCFWAVLFSVIGAMNCMALTGVWRGDIEMGSSRLPLVFNFREGASGNTEGTMDSPQQNARGIPLDIVFCSPDSLSLECKMIGASYRGKIINGKIEGVFSQGVYRFPLLLALELSLSERRPQTPARPFPYIEKDTLFFSSDGTELAGTLTFPAEPGNEIPVVVMVTGSGPQNRDEEIFEHRPFAVIADFLARNGIASFRFDDRGVASSKGNYLEGTVDTFREDARSAYRFVKSMPQFGKAGILGHSEGGTLAILVAADEDPDFIISLAGMAVPAIETLMQQNIRHLEKSGITGNQRDSSVRLIRMMLETIKNQSITGDSSQVDIDKLCEENSLDVPPVVLQSLKRSNLSRSKYFDSFVGLDPTSSLKSIKCRVLAINGTKDVQVDADVNLEAFRQNVKSVEIRRMDGLNHLMQHAVIGEVSEYGDIRETVAPEVLEIIADFIGRK